MIDHSKEILESFNPREPEYRFKLWVRVVTPDTIWTHVYWGRIAVVAGAGAVMLWLVIAAGIWGFVRHERGYTEASYLDLALYPLRHEQYQRGLARHSIATARVELQRQNYAKADAQLQAGLALLPDDAPGRRLLAVVQVRLGRPDLALVTLADGDQLAGAELDELKLIFGALLETKEDDRLLILATKLLPATADAVATHPFVALQAATAHLERGRYDEAERLLTDWRLGDTPAGSLLLARCDWERGYPRLAIERLQREVARLPRNDEPLARLIRYRRELGQTGEARRDAVLRQANAPALPGPRLDLLHLHHAAADMAAEHRELTAYLNDFTADPSAQLLLADFAVESAQPDLTLRLLSVARTRNYPLAPFNVAHVRALFAAQQFQAAYDQSLTALREEGGESTTLASTLALYRCLALYGLKDTARAEPLLKALLGQASLRAADTLFLARQLRRQGATASARAVLDRAIAVDPRNQAALTELVRLDAETGELAPLAENLPKLLRLRQPSRTVLEEALRRLDQPASAALREQMKAALARGSATPGP